MEGRDAASRPPGFVRSIVLVVLTAALASAADSGGDPEADRGGGEQLPPITFSGTGQAGTGSVGVRVGYYSNGDSDDGNPYLDETSSVVEAIFIADYDVSDRLSTWGQFSFDIVSSASIVVSSSGMRLLSSARAPTTKRMTWAIDPRPKSFIRVTSVPGR